MGSHGARSVTGLVQLRAQRDGRGRVATGRQLGESGRSGSCGWAPRSPHPAAPGRARRPWAPTPRPPRRRTARTARTVSPAAASASAATMAAARSTGAVPSTTPASSPRMRWRTPAAPPRSPPPPRCQLLPPHLPQRPRAPRLGHAHCGTQFCFGRRPPPIGSQSHGASAPCGSNVLATLHAQLLTHPLPPSLPPPAAAAVRPPAAAAVRPAAATPRRVVLLSPLFRL